MDYSATRNDLNTEETNEEEEEEEARFRMVNVIFLPFHAVFRTVVILCIVLKCLLAPPYAVFPSTLCKSVPLVVEYMIKMYFYVDIIYAVDMFLHLAHRQMADEASKREFVPKSASGLVLDVGAVIPFLSLLNTDACPETKLWPNILGFTEILCFYRIIQYFDLKDTHSYVKLFIGYIISYILLINCLSCIVLIFTYHGLCSACDNNIYDWRMFLLQRFPYLNDGYNTYFFAYEYVGSFILNLAIDDFKPGTYLEYFVVMCLMIISFAVRICVLEPKLFCEEILRSKRFTMFHARATNILDETEMRNLPTKELEAFYSLIWTKTQGVTAAPTMMARLPWYIRLQMEQDIVWPVFFHSPTLRKTSSSYRRWICSYLRMEHKTPGERFFSGKHCYTHLYYLHSGTVQFMSSEDGVTPVLSVSDGTVFGDISFYLPPLQRKTIVRCLTYCNIIVVPRSIILLSMNKFPDDRSIILTSVRYRIDHAKRLYACKTKIRGVDRVEDEGVKWLKDRWWQIFKALETWKRSSKKDSTKCSLPSERSVYHCAKYIGQLVLCQANQLRLKAIFCRVKFPWLLTEYSSFTIIWNQIVIYTVYVVVLTYPPNLARAKQPSWFSFVQCIVNIIYGVDIIFSLLASTEDVRHNTSIKAILVKKLKSFQFILDVTSTAPVEVLTVMFKAPNLYEIIQFNRLLKVHRVISNKFRHWKRDRDPLNAQLVEVYVAPMMFMYVLAYCCYLSPRVISNLNSIQFWFGPRVCLKDLDPKCKQDEDGMLWIFYYFIFEHLFGTVGPTDVLEIALVFFTTCFIFFIKTYVYCKLLAIWYLKHYEIGNFNTLTANMMRLYVKVGVTGDTLRNIERFFLCHWRWRRGAALLRVRGAGAGGGSREPQRAAWSAHVAAAERAIAGSAAFAHASASLVAELAKRATFTILPRGLTLELFGIHSECVTWIIRGEMKCEYKNEKGELVSNFERPTDVLSLSVLLPGVPCLRTYVTATDCEVLSIGVKDLNIILKHFPEEWEHINNCATQMKPVFEELFLKYLKQHQIYQKKIREQRNHERQPTASTEPATYDVTLEPAKPGVTEEPATHDVILEPAKPGVMEETATHDVILEPAIHGVTEEPALSPPTSFPFRIFIDDPESPFIRCWIVFRAVTILIHMFFMFMREFCIHLFADELFYVIWYCDLVTLFDIIINFVLPYYSARGVAVRARGLTARRYLARGFLVDVLAMLPIVSTIRLLAGHYSFSLHDLVLFAKFCKSLSLYKLLGCLDYYVDVPTRYRYYVLLIKWQIFSVALGLAITNIFFRHCMELIFNDKDEFVRSEQRNFTCWSYFLTDKVVTHKQRKLYRALTAFTFDLTQSAMMSFSINNYRIYDDGVFMTWAIYLFSSFIFGLISTYCQTLLVVATKGDSQFQQRLEQLLRFLREERVDERTVRRCLTYYNYQWMRLQGVNISELYKNIHEVSGLVRDIQCLVFKSTFNALSGALDGGSMLERRLAAQMSVRFWPPGEELARERHLAPRVCLLSSGRVAVSSRGRHLATLTEGCLFGQLSDAVPRPLRITARSETYVHTLEMPYKDFLEILSEESKRKLSSTPGYRFDFMKLKKVGQEGEDSSDSDLLAKDNCKIIKLPLTAAPVDTRASLRYSRLLFAEWFWNTTLALALTVLKWRLHQLRVNTYFMFILFTSDVFHFMVYVSDFFMVEYTIVKNKCVYQYIGWRRLLDVFFYVDTISIIMPIIGRIFHYDFESFRLLRIYSYIYFYKHFCKDFKHPRSALLLKVGALMLLLLAMLEFWLFKGCTFYKPYYFKVPTDVPKFVYDSVDQNEWKIVDFSRDRGCIRMTPTYNSSDGTEKYLYVLTKHWYGEYLAGLTLIFSLLTRTRIILFFSGSRTQLKILLGLLTYWVRLWITAAIISYIYTKSQEIYLFAHKVESLKLYFKSNGVSENLLNTLTNYFGKLWKKQKGSCIPEFATEAPPCLREDIFSSLYMHHFTNLPMFSVFPDYFLRQLIVHVQKKTVFPGNLIVQEGDINPTMYFIHEGEVERWATDAKGEGKMASVLTMNSHFGVTCGATQNFPFQYSYYSRTVVVLIVLNYYDWQDLLDAYPEFKKQFQIACLKRRHDIRKARENTFRKQC